MVELALYIAGFLAMRLLLRVIDRTLIEPLAEHISTRLRHWSRRARHAAGRR